MSEENKETYSHYLVCVDCRMKFSIQSEHRNNTEIGLEDIRCPQCGEKVELNAKMLSPLGGKPQKSITQRREMNKLQSREAREKARRLRQIDEQRGRNEMITVKSYQEGKNKGKEMEVPKKAIEGIKEKVKNHPIFQDDKNK